MEQTTTNTAPAFSFEQDWENDGMLKWHNAKTLNRYKELDNLHPDTSNMPVFFAFGNKQFAEHSAEFRRKYGEDAPIKSAGAGLYGTPEGIRAVFKFYSDNTKRIAEECDPQEVYCYEFNNHESCIAYDGDANAIRLVIDIFGEEAARTVKRFCAFYSIDELLKSED